MRILRLKHFACLRLLLGLAVLGAAISTCLADHFRASTLSWSRTAAPGEVEFYLRLGYKISGSGLPTTGNVVGLSIALPDRVDFGDGQRSGRPLCTVIEANQAEDWFVCETRLRHSYGTAGTYLAGIFGGYRWLNLNNRAGGEFNVKTQVVPYSANSSPSTPVRHMMSVIASAQSTFAVPAVDPENDPLRWRISTDAEAGGGPSPANLTIDSATGIATWNNELLDSSRVWTVQFVVEDLDSAGNPKSSTAIDVLLKIVPNAAPSCNISLAGPVTAALNVPLAFQVTATDPNANDLVTLTATGLPPGATVQPALPATGGTVQAMVFWTPTQEGTFTAAFQAQDEVGAQSTCSLTIHVVRVPTTVACPPPVTVESSSPVGTSVTLNAQVNNESGLGVIATWYVNGVPVETDIVGGGAPPTSALISLTRVFGLGQHEVRVEVSDGGATPATCSTSVRVIDTTGPTFACPGNRSIFIGGSVPDFTSGLGASDNVTPAGAITVTQSPSPGNILNRAGDVTVTIFATDLAGNTTTCQVQLTVIDNRMPTVSYFINSTVLWPPNHEFCYVGFNYLVDPMPEGAEVQIQVYSNDDDLSKKLTNAKEMGDGNHSPDAQQIANQTLALRRERTGEGKTRVYLITVSVRTLAGLLGRTSATVVVPEGGSPADLAKANAEAAAAKGVFDATGSPPAGYYLVGDGPVVGPKQSVECGEVLPR